MSCQCNKCECGKLPVCETCNHELKNEFEEPCIDCSKETSKWKPKAGEEVV